MANVEFYSLPEPNLGDDITACSGETVVLDAGEGYINYLWTSGENTRWLEVTKNGNYQVWVTDIHNCVGTDDINVYFFPKPSSLSIKHY